MNKITAIYFAFIVLPIIFMIVLAFIFSSSVTQIRAEQLKLNCPYPVMNAHVILDNITNNMVVNYHLNYSTIYVNEVTVFDCFFDLSGNPSANTRVYEPGSGSSFFSAFNNAYAWMGYIYTSATAFFGKIVAISSIMFLIINAPAQVTGLVFFTYINLVLITFILIGVFMVIRG